LSPAAAARLAPWLHDRPPLPPHHHLHLQPKQMLDYNVPGGKLNRGMAVYDVLASIKGAEVRAGHRTGV
jgi:hypothetical protein